MMSACVGLSSDCRCGFLFERCAVSRNTRKPNRERERDIVRDREIGSVSIAASRAQEVEMRKLEPQAQASRELLNNHPILRDQIVNVQTIGSLPHFRGGPHEIPRPSGLPYDASKTLDMVGKIRNDVRAGRVLVISSHQAGEDAPILATPTPTAQKRLPDRTLSSDFRIISG